MNNLVILSKLKICILFVLLFFSSFAFSESENSWTIAATEFVYKNDINVTEYERGIAKVIPSMILEQLIGVKNHNVTYDEIFTRDFDSLKKERLSLFLELSKSQKNLDSLMLNHLTTYQVEKKIKKEKQVIQDLSKELDENLLKQNELLEKEKTDELKHSSEKSSVESVKIYNLDPTNLFYLNKDSLNTNYSSFDFSNKISSEKINCLITGSIMMYGKYIAVTVELFLYPGAKSICVLTEIGSVDNLKLIAENLSVKLIPIIENSILCEVKIKINPPELKSKTWLIIDSIVYKNIPEKINLSNGVHYFIFQCEGYRTESFSYGFGYEKKYLIELSLKPEEEIDLSVVLKKSIEGNLFYNGNKSNDNEISIKINHNDVLGYFFTKNQNLIFYQIPNEMIFDNSTYMANIKDYNISNYIEKRRRMMYISYSALVCSLPFLFYSYSNYSNLANAYNLNYQNMDVNEINKYKTMTNIGIGITAGMGVWFVGELVAYLISANKVLPIEPKKVDLNYLNDVKLSYDASDSLTNKNDSIPNKREENIKEK